MNPAIHHPRWYLATKLLTEAEVVAAENVREDANDENGTYAPGALVCSGQLSQFTFGGFRIVCVPNNWTIMTTATSDFERARDICASVFEVLPHTPVSAYGMNLAFHRDTHFPDVGTQLARLAEALPLGLPSRAGVGSSSASFRYETKADGDDTVVMIEASVKDPKKVFVGLQRSCQIREEGLFDLRPMLNASFARDVNDFAAWLDEILTHLEKSIVGARS